jgi:phosphomannomutase/phosphoglucomutase
MLKREKKRIGDDGSGGREQVYSKGNSLRQYWMIALLATMISTAIGSAYLILIRNVAVQDAQIQLVADNIARAQAASIQQMFQRYEVRLRTAASSPLAVAAIGTRNTDDIALVEKTILDYFPGATSMRLITIGSLGTAGLEGNNLGLRNHIEVDLLRRTSEGSTTVPESYQFEGVWLTSLATLIDHPRDDDKRAVALVSINNKVITDNLSALDTRMGQSSLQQIFRRGGLNRADEIAAAGDSSARQYTGSYKLNRGNWQLVFTPSPWLLAQLQIDFLPNILALAAVLATVLLAMLLLLLLHQRSLAAEVERILTTADHKSPLTLKIPQLLPLAKQLRLSALRLAASRPGQGARQSPRRQPPKGSSVPGDEASNRRAQPTGASKPNAAATKDSGAGKPVRQPTAIREGGFPSHIFRAYDIRGIVPNELSDDLVMQIGGAIGTLAGKEGQQALIVGCDGRNSSPSIKNVLVKALLDSGRDVIDIGMVPTPLLYYATNTLATKSGIMVTGSHNPAEYNGLKITINGSPLAGESLAQLRDQVTRGKFSTGAGRVLKKDIRKDYIEAIVSDMVIASPLKVVLDAGNGVAGSLAPQLLEELGCEVVPLYCDVDGDFPNHHPDPSVDENLGDLQATVVKEKADFGIAYDGDGDRLAVISATGEIVRADKLIMLFAQDVLSRNPGADVVFDIKCSRHLNQLVSRYGGRPILWKTGHAFMRQKIIETGALLGGEFSGHIYFGERWFGFDDGLYASARLAEILSGAGTDLTSLLTDFPNTENTPEISIPVTDDEKFELMARLEEVGDFSPGKVNNLDGIRVDYNDGWGLLRASNTVPALVARFEAHDADSLERIQQQFREQLAAVAPGLDPGF